MYVDAAYSTQGGKTYRRYLLRESYRQEGKVKHRTIANLSHCSEEEIAAIRLALRHKGDLALLGSVKELTAQQGSRIGYDVTSSYLEGVNNVLAAFGYNRDGKKGKQQLVIGLLTGPEGAPVAVRVFAGNTQDPKTVTEQIRTLAQGCGVSKATRVGDRGRLKLPQLPALTEHEFHYITAITKRLRGDIGLPAGAGVGP